VARPIWTVIPAYEGLILDAGWECGRYKEALFDCQCLGGDLIRQQALFYHSLSFDLFDFGMSSIKALLWLAAAALTAAQDDTSQMCSVKMERVTVNNCLTNAKVPQASVGSDSYKFEINPYNTRVPYTPAAVAMPTTAKHVQDAVKCATQSSVRVSAKSGGHSYASFGLGGENGHLIVDFKNMHNVTVNPTTFVATIQPGSRIGNVAQALYVQGKRAMSHGTCPP